tara:strand:- start:313 stop:477 length:165 start_codon:yes stop_codon:yes gene_type:complete
MVKKSRSKHQRYQTVDPLEKKGTGYPKIHASPFKRPSLDDRPAGYGNYGPQMLQ